MVDDVFEKIGQNHVKKAKRIVDDRERYIYIGYHNVKKIEILECKKKIGIFFVKQIKLLLYKVCFRILLLKILFQNMDIYYV